MAGNPIKYSDLFQDDGALDKLLKGLSSVEDRYKVLTDEIVKGYKRIYDAAKKLDVSNEDNVDTLKKYEKELVKLIENWDKAQKVEKEIIETKKKAKKVLTEEEKLLKKKNQLTEEAAIENAKLKVEIAELNKENKQQARESLGLVGAYEKQSKLLIKLRREYKDLAAAGQANTEEAHKLLLQVTELDAELKDIDKSVGQTQRSVGDYRDAMRGALEDTTALSSGMLSAIDSSGILGGVLSKLQTIIGLLTAAKQKLTIETEENTVAEAVNTKATKSAAITQGVFSKALNVSKIAFKAFNTALKASYIGIILIGLGSLVSFLTQTQEGLTKVRAATLSAGAIMGALTTRLIDVGNAFVSLIKLSFIFPRILINGIMTVIDGFSSLGTVISNVFDYSDEAKKENEKATNSFKSSASDLKKVFTDLPNDISNAFSGISTLLDGLGNQIKGIVQSAEPLAKQLYAIELANAQRILQQEELLAKSEKLEEIEGDATRSFKEREEAIRGSIKAQKEAADLAVKTAEERKRMFELETAFALQGKAETDAIKIERIEFEKEILAAKKDAAIKGLQLVKVANQLEQDLIEKNLDILIDGFDNQKTINEQLIADEKKAFVERKKILEETKKLQADALTSEVAEIQKSAKAQIDIQDLIATSDSVRLNEKIRALGLSEILEGRLLEVIRDNRTATNDLAVAEKELNESRITFLNEVIEKTKELEIANETNLDNQAKLEEKYRYEKEIAELELQITLAKNDAELTTALLAKKTQLEKEHNREVANDRIESLERQNDEESKLLEISLLEQGKKESDINKALRDQRIEALEDEIKTRQGLQLDSLDQELELAQLKATKEKEIEEKTASEIKEIRDTVAQASFDAFQERIDKENDLLEKQSQANAERISQQQQRAAQGLENTLAFEEAERAKLEKKKLEQEKRQIRLEKIKALYSAYSAAASSGDKNAILKAIADIGILTGLEATLTSLGTGTGEHGTIEEFLDAKKDGSKGGNSLRNGVFKGESHKRRNKGIPLLVEGGEGILSVKQMKSLGSENFQYLTRALDNGYMGSDFFGDQVKLVPQVNTFNLDLSSLKSELREVKSAIENKPVQQVNVEQLSKSYTDFIETNIQGNKKNISRYRVNKPRL